MLHRTLSVGVLFIAGLAVIPQDARAGLLSYEAFLDGPSESPPNASPGTGYATLLIDTDTDMMTLNVEFQDLIGTTTAAHIHGPTAMPGAGTAGVAIGTPTFPVGVTGGNYLHTYDLTDTGTYNATFLANSGGTAAGAKAVLIATLTEGRGYFNIHTNVFPGGEIRGFFSPKAVPEPTSWMLLGVGATCVRLVRRRRFTAPSGQG